MKMCRVFLWTSFPESPLTSGIFLFSPVLQDWNHTTREKGCFKEELFLHLESSSQTRCDRCKSLLLFHKVFRNKRRHEAATVSKFGIVCCILNVASAFSLLFQHFFN